MQSSSTPAKRPRRAPTFKSNLTRLRYAVRAASINAGMTEDAYRDLLESFSPYRYARLLDEPTLEYVLEKLENRRREPKPVTPEVVGDEEALAILG